MDKQNIIEKIRAMLALQQSTEFNGEAEAAGRLISKLCKEHGIDIDTDLKPTATDDVFGDSFKRTDFARANMFDAVARFYGAKAYRKSTSEGFYLGLIGTERQRLETEIYFEFLMEVMENETTRAYEAEKVLTELRGMPMISKRTFANNFRKSFAMQVKTRLVEMAKDREPDDHDAAVQDKLSTMRFGKTKGGSYGGAGAAAGREVGQSVGLQRQQSGAAHRALTGS